VCTSVFVSLVVFFDPTIHWVFGEWSFWPEKKGGGVSEADIQGYRLISYTSIKLWIFL
jgi:hypothetical protein